MPNRVLWASFWSPETNAVGSYDVGNTANRVALVLARVGDGFSFSAASVGGQSLTLLDSTSVGISNRGYALFGGAITVTGTQSVVVNSSGFGNTKAITVLVYDGVASIRDAVLAWASNATPAATLATQSGDLCVISGSDGDFGRTFTPESPAVGFEVATGRINAEETATGASTTVNGTLNGSANWEIGAWALVPASAGDTTAPVLSSPTGTATGSTTATVGATTDEANGTQYAVVTTSATAPSAAQIKAGQDHTGSAAAWGGSITISATGANTHNATGLPASTALYAHLIHTDVAANDSNIVSSAQFTTSAPADPPVITSQPSNQTVKRGQTATFTVAATGSGTVTYQWQRNPGGVGSWADISGATSASYTTPATTISGGSANDQDDYRCNVSDDDAGPVASNAVTLTVQQCVLALNSAGYEFGDGNAPATMSVLASTELQVAAYPLTEWPPASAIATATATTGTNGRLADLGDDDLIFGTTYRVIARNAADGETWAWTMAAS